MAPNDEPRRDGEGRERQLRLAVVCYGGASLAIYMHGMTKEIHRLVKASIVDDGQARTPTEAVYRELLDELAKPDDVRTRVVVDVVTGTSAGGINGVCLAKAVAHDLSQDPLRRVWIECGDIDKLVPGPSWIPWKARMVRAIATGIKKPLLKSEAITQWMYGALRGMDATGSAERKSLMPDGHELELFVTTTDFYGYDRDLVIEDPKLIHDHAHRHVMTFRYRDGHSDFTQADNVALAFAARVTSSFPGAFAPVSFETFASDLQQDRVDVSQVRRKLFRIYDLSNAEPSNTFFVDGGVLDNRPFGHAIRAIKKRPAETEVDRHLLYLEPDPGKPGPRPPGKAPNPVATVLAAIAGIPRKEPILDDILEVSRHNERVRRIRDIIEMTFDDVGERVEGIIGGDLARLAENASSDELTSWGERLSEEVRRAAGPAYATYMRSKVSGVVDRFARTICRLSDFPEDCNQAAFVRSVLRAWATSRLFTEQSGRPVLVDDHGDFLRTFDLDYRVRRLRFVIAALNWWYEKVGEPGHPTREQLDDGKKTLYDAERELLAVMEGDKISTDLTEEVLAVFAQEPIDKWVYERKEGPEEYADAQRAELAHLEQELGKALSKALEGFSERLYRRVHEVMSGWSDEPRRDLLVRYLGFPIWDALLYPIQSVADVGERDHVQVVRMSPDDAKLLAPLQPGKPKLAGVGLIHFGAFFDARGREMDYLWGRLDGAERLIGLLLGPQHADEERARWCREAFRAIVAEEQGLKRAGPLLAHAQRFANG